MCLESASSPPLTLLPCVPTPHPCPGPVGKVTLNLPLKPFGDEKVYNLLWPLQAFKAFLCLFLHHSVPIHCTRLYIVCSP